MSTAHITARALADDAAGCLSDRDRAGIAAHVQSCARCQMERDRIAAGFRELRDSEPAQSTESLRLNAMRAAALLSSAPRPLFNGWVPALLGGAVGIALATAFLLLKPLAIEIAPAPVVEGGRLTFAANSAAAGQVVPLNVSVEVAEEAELQIKRVATIRAKRGARFLMRETGASLQAGEMTFAVERRTHDRPWTVTTAEASIRVIGTGFSVARGLGGADRQTSISVDHGIVEVTRLATLEVRELAAGSSWLISEAVPLPKPVVMAEPKVPAESEPTIEPPIVVSVPEIRSKIRQGQTKLARKMIERARQGKRTTSELAELAIMEAESYLADKQYAESLRGYVAVVQRFGKSAKTEDALIAAAQVALDHPEVGMEGKKLLERYLAEYPKGRYRDVAQRLLRAY